MNNFKKLILLLGLAVSLTACGGETTSTSEKPKTETSQTQTETETKTEESEKPAEEEKGKEDNLQEKIDKIGKDIYKDNYRSATINWDYENAKYTEDGDIDENQTPISYLNIEVKVADNLTENMIVNGFLMKSVDFLEEIQDIKYDRVFIGGKADFQDTYGNIEELYAIKLELSKSEVDKINFENFNYKDIIKLANVFDLHSSIKYTDN